MFYWLPIVKPAEQLEFGFLELMIYFLCVDGPKRSLDTFLLSWIGTDVFSGVLQEIKSFKRVFSRYTLL